MMRDIRTDWRQWSPAERVLAALFLGAATVVIGTIYVLHAV